MAEASAKTNRNYTITLAPGKLANQLAIRGKTQKDLVEASGVSHITIGRAYRGEPINPKTWNALLRFLAAHPVIEGAEDLLGLTA
jgi:hypothetical protein